MSFIVWNCRGLGNLRTGKELEVVIRAKDPSVVFLAEIWADEARLKEVQRNIKFDNLFFVKETLEVAGVWLYIGKIPLILVWILSPNTTLIP